MTEQQARRESIVLALAGDAMLGRAVGAEIEGVRGTNLFCSELEAAVCQADLFVLNLECCISRGGTRWRTPGKSFFFRAPPEAAEVLARLGVDCVTLANNHALDFGRQALLDTLDHLAGAGIQAVGAGPNLVAARSPVVLESGGFRLAVVAFSDHPSDFAASDDQPGVAFADIRSGQMPPWLFESLAGARNGADAVLLSPHWGPNLSLRPPDAVRNAGKLLGPHATLTAGHSAHVFHGVEGNVIYDLGDFFNDYASIRPPRSLAAGLLHKLCKELSRFGAETAVAARRRAGQDVSDANGSLWQQQQRRATRIARMLRARTLRSDLGLLLLVTLDRHGPRRLEALPLKLGHCRTELAYGEDAAFAHRRFRKICCDFGTRVDQQGNRSVISWR